MIKRIPVDALKQGMYISDLNAAWIPDSNLKKQGFIRNDAVVEKIKKLGISELYIDTSIGADTQDGLTESELENQSEEALQKAGDLAPLMKPVVSIDDEMSVAAKVHTEALDLVSNMISGVRDGQTIKLNAFEEVSEGMLDSVFRNHNALSCLGRIREKDSYLMQHSVNVAVLMSIFGKSLALDKEVMKEAAIGAMLHDIGKILLPDEVLQKSGSLSPEESKSYQRHVELGEQLLAQTEGVPELAVTIAAQHHENFDGSGYPRGLSRHQISPFGKMAAITNAYDEITAERVGQKTVPPSAALKMLLSQDKQFDPSLVRHFIRCIGIYPIGSLVLMESGRLAIVIEANEFDQRLPKVKLVYHTKFRTFIKVETLDLSKPNCQDRIDKAVDPDKYKIRVGDFL